MKFHPARDEKVASRQIDWPADVGQPRIWCPVNGSQTEMAQCLTCAAFRGLYGEQARREMMRPQKYVGPNYVRAEVVRCAKEDDSALKKRRVKQKTESGGGGALKQHVELYAGKSKRYVELDVAEGDRGRGEDIQAALDEIGPGGGEIRLADATWVVDKPLDFKWNNTMIMGPATLECSAGTGDVAILNRDGVTGCGVQNVKVESSEAGDDGEG